MDILYNNFFNLYNNMIYIFMLNYNSMVLSNISEHIIL
jgi:hypothetical protein